MSDAAAAAAAAATLQMTRLCVNSMYRKLQNKKQCKLTSRNLGEFCCVFRGTHRKKMFPHFLSTSRVSMVVDRPKYVQLTLLKMPLSFTSWVARLLILSRGT